MRLGARVTRFTAEPPSVLKRLYGDKELVTERHRHRYEVNTKYRKQLAQKGLVFVGEDESGERMEVLEFMEVR